ncbi:MAG: dTMP kinase [Deltaproteobacteria bacterium]|nr:dTMP kinase [Deltaproteobacteria bacterium]MBI3295985.1 dTMP kinase [Deltaproteobacteria bacterium]
MLITLEGGEGAGKSTQARLIIRELKKRRIRCLLTAEPGGTTIGKKIRKLLLDRTNAIMAPRAELLLYQADRAQHVNEKIRPALEAGYVVVSDRFFDSSVVYQGYCRKLGVDEVYDLSLFATGGLEPDLTFFLDLDPKVGFMRIRHRGSLDRLEREKIRFHQDVRRGFLGLARRCRGRMVVIDASASTEEVNGAILSTLERRLRALRKSR